MPASVKIKGNRGVAALAACVERGHVGGMAKTLTDAFERYLLALRNTAADEQTEMTSRAALEALLNAAAAAYAPTGTVVTHEPLRAQGKGAPDFKIASRGMILGYVENKAMGENLAKVAKSDQIRKYLTLSPNILLTDYLHWMWITPDGVQEARIADAGALGGRTAHVRPERAAELERLLQGFYSRPPQAVGTAKALAEALATRSQLLRDFLGDELARQDKAHSGGVLMGLYNAFKAQVSHEITLKEFADALAQTLAYGLFLAKLNSAPKDTGAQGEKRPPVPITLVNAKQFVPTSFGLIQELVGFLDRLNEPNYADVRWVVEEVLSIINNLDVAAIGEDLSFRNRKARRGTRAGSEDEHRLFERDPFIYFYEDYLAKYDAGMRKSRGVYYTPPPIVNFIVRAINDILKDTFGIAEGLADRKRVTVLDFACGTGTFLVEVLERIFEEIGGPDAGKAPLVVRDHILKNIHGFEYLIAPYTIAHLKLSQYLADRGHKLADGERLQVYLTNTLEPIDPQTNYFVPELSRETEQAQAVKDKPILVITGNPPYAGHSRNPSKRTVPYESLTEDIKKRGKFKTKTIKTSQGPKKVAEFLTETGQAIEVYKEGPDEIDKPRQTKWLQNDYVKFLRFAEKKMGEVEQGVVAVITAHSYLDGQTFTYMRDSLAKSFDQILIVDLHGNSDKKETTPTGGLDQNVFDIATGVAIALFIKKPGIKKGIFHADWWGSRQAKYEKAVSLSLKNAGFKVLEPKAPQFLFVPHKTSEKSAYSEWWPTHHIFSRTGNAAPGLVTLHDEFAISFSKEESFAKVDSLVSASSEEEARRSFKLCAQDQWNFDTAKAELERVRGTLKAKEVLYRPFDKRWTIWSSLVAVHLRARVNTHMLRDNVALLTTRATKGENFSHVMAADAPVEAISLSSKTSNNAFVFPLYMYPPPPPADDGKPKLFADGDDPFAGKDRIENIAPEFRTWIDARYDHAFTPEQIFGFIYAVLHAPTYRSRYADFLRTDFPRVPFPETRPDFETLSALGWELAEVHLMRREVPVEEDAAKARPAAAASKGTKLGTYFGKGENRVEKPRWSEVERKVWINEAQGFADIPADVWAFTIGGYQVIDKYLKSRKGRTLSLDEIENVEKVANILAFTIRRMKRIDRAYTQAFGEAETGDEDVSAVDATGADDIHSDPGIMGGEHVFRGTRVPVRAVAEMLYAGADEAELLEGYPTLSPERLELAKRWADENPRSEESRGPDNAWRVVSRKRVPHRREDEAIAKAQG